MVGVEWYCYGDVLYVFSCCLFCVLNVIGIVFDVFFNGIVDVLLSWLFFFK